MPYKEKIRRVAKDFPGLVESERLEILNRQLVELKEMGFNNLISNFLFNHNLYTLAPFLFEIYICRWIYTFKDVTGVFYEPPINSKPLDFIFRINDATFHIEVKTITQIINETIKKKIVKQINTRMASKTSNIVEIWLSEDIEPKGINQVVDWITKQAVKIAMGEKKEYVIDEEVLAWIKVIRQSEKHGSVGVENRNRRRGRTLPGSLSLIQSGFLRFADLGFFTALINLNSFVKTVVSKIAGSRQALPWIPD